MQFAIFHMHDDISISAAIFIASRHYSSATYRHLRKRARSLAKRVIFITGDVMGKDTWQFLRRTKAPYLTKPFDEEKLEKEINRILTQCE
jgi:CheY-like chemotaxis protein